MESAILLAACGALAQPAQARIRCTEYVPKSWGLWNPITVSGNLAACTTALRTKGQESLQLDIQFANRPVKGDTGNAKLTGCLGHIISVGA